MSSWLVPLVTAVAGALGAVATVGKLRPERNKIDADAALTLQQATTEGIENLQKAARESVRQARAEARRAHEEAAEAQRTVAEARAEVRQMRAELLQARVELAELRQSAAAERAAAAGREASAQSTIRGLSLELQMARLGGGSNGASGVLGEFGG